MKTLEIYGGFSHSFLIILTDKIVNFSEVTSAHQYNNNNDNNLFNLSSFTISEANYLLTSGCHGVASSVGPIM